MPDEGARRDGLVKQVERMGQDTDKEPLYGSREDNLAELAGLDKTVSPPDSSGILPQALQGVFFILLALAAGWLGGRWASQPTEQEPAVVAPVVEPETQVDTAPADVVPPSSPTQETYQQAYLGIRGKGARLTDVNGVALTEPEIQAAFDGLASRVQTPQEQNLFDHLRALYGDDLALTEPEVQAAFAGLASRVQTPQERKLFDYLRALYGRLHLIGVQITEIFPGSPAARAGLQATVGSVPVHLRELSTTIGHIIIGANGRLIRSEEELARRLVHSAPGAPMELLVSSADGESYEVILVTLAAAPPAAASVPDTVDTEAAEGGGRVAQSPPVEQTENPVP